MRKQKIKRIILTIESPVFYQGFVKDVEKYIRHSISCCTEEELIFSSKEKMTRDKRKLPKPPEYCKGCKWLKGKECWYGGSYYGTDFSDDDCYASK